MVMFYKHHIPDWMEGTGQLDHLPYRVYHVICELIYLNEGPIMNNELGIAGHCKTTVAGYRRALDTLLELGKLALIDGRVTNDRVMIELSAVDQNRANAAEGGRNSRGTPKSSRDHRRMKPGSSPDHMDMIPGSSADDPHMIARSSADETPSTPDKPLNNNDRATAPLFSLNSLKDKTRQDKKRQDGKGDGSSGLVGLVSINRTTEQDAEHERSRVLSNYDFVSTDGTVLILADEFKVLEADLPSIRDVRALVRHSCRSWLLEVEPSHRKQALLSWLRKKNAETAQRVSLKRDDKSKREVADADAARRREADKALAVRARLAQERKQRLQKMEDGNAVVAAPGATERQPGGEFPITH